MTLYHNGVDLQFVLGTEEQASAHFCNVKFDGFNYGIYGSQ